MIDEPLLHALRNRQADAFKQVVDSHQHRVVNICYRFVHDKEEAEDIAQETFLEVYRSIDRFRGEAALSTWIHRIAVSKSLDFVRKRDREKRGGRLRILLGLGEKMADIPAPVSAEPDKVLEDAERRRILLHTISKLPRNQGIAFVLSKYDGVDYREIASILKTTVPSVESLIHRAKKNLQKMLRSYYESISKR